LSGEVEGHVKKEQVLDYRDQAAKIKGKDGSGDAQRPGEDGLGRAFELSDRGLHYGDLGDNLGLQLTSGWHFGKITEFTGPRMRSAKKKSAPDQGEEGYQKGGGGSGLKETRITASFVPLYHV